jgi:ankyrin repeat protein
MTEPISELMAAQYRGDLATVERLRAGGHELTIHEAAAVGDAARLGELLDRDAELVHAWSPDGGQPLHFAAFFGHADAVRLLVDRGAEVNVHARGFNGVAPINSAAANDPKPNDVCTEIVSLLLERGADPHAAQGGGATALHTAAFTRNAELARLLLARGADPDARAADGRTPRSLAPDLFA